MKLMRTLQFIVIVTSLALVYIHMQMDIIELAYQGNEKEQDIRHLIEENGNITYTILTLKSSNHLGITMLSEEAGMEFVDPSNIVQIDTEEYLNEGVQASLAQNDNKNSSLLSYLSFGKRAEARNH